MKIPTARLQPAFLRRLLQIRNARKELDAIDAIACDASALRACGQISADAIFRDAAGQSAWQRAEADLAKFAIPDGTGGVNPGDRRAIFHLVHHFRPVSVLEIGTHIGASTVHIATALSSLAGACGPEPRLVSVDIADVNDGTLMPWRKYGGQFSPADMICALGCERWARFATGTSMDFLSAGGNKFDFIFLDGDHSAHTVYREVPAALKRLNPGGVILLHDYFPDMKPLWSNGALIPGPYLAIERLRKERAGIRVLPLGTLPWSTKLGSNLTSLALLLGMS